jgi:hypothetical protein
MTVLETGVHRGVWKFLTMGTFLWLLGWLFLWVLWTEHRLPINDPDRFASTV